MKILDIDCDGKNHVGVYQEGIFICHGIQKFPDAVDCLEGFICG